MDLFLASTSPYRRSLLQRLQIPFRCEAPEVDESPLPGEAPERLAERLAVAKARSLAERYPGALVIGSDQVASIDGSCIGKPGGHNAAVAQLRASSGNSVRFFTGLALACHERKLARSLVVPFTVHFRTLAEREIENYVTREKPFDCAGSFKYEALGIALFEKMEGDDPTSLEGLPLIATCRLLREAGVDVLSLDSPQDP